MPGSVLSRQSQGCHTLIRQGAVLVESVEQVLEELNALPPLMRAPPPHPKPGPAGGDTPETPTKTSNKTSTRISAKAVGSPATTDPVLQALGHDPLSMDALVERCGWPVHTLSAHLLTLELDGQVARLPGGLYQRRQAA